MHPPAGDEIAYVVSDSTPSWVRAVDVRTGVVRDVADCGRCVLDNVQLAWSPDGAIIAVDSGTSGIWTVLAHPAPVIADGSGVVQLLSITGRDPSFSRDGKHLMYVDASRRVAIVDAQNGSGPRVLSFHDVWWAAWSPDGTRIAYVVDPLDPRYHGGGDPYVAQMWVADRDGKHRTLLHEIPRCCIGGLVEPPTWSPDGRSLAWLAPIPPRSAPDDLVLVDRDGSKTVDVRIGLAGVTPTWLGDGRSP